MSTKLGNRITNERRRPALPVEMAARVAGVRLRHPEVRVRARSAEYNCIGLVFGNRRAWLDPDEVAMILGDDGYKVVPDDRVQTGDVVVYRDDDGGVTHVAVVHKREPILSNGTWDTWVVSQWGGDGEYYHRINDVDSRLGRPTEFWTQNDL